VERGASPLGQGVKGGPSSPLAAPNPLPLGFSPTWEGEGGWHPSLAYIRRGGGALFFTQQFETIFLRFLSLFLLPRVDSPCLESALGWGFLHHTHAVVLLESGSESIFFPLLFWFGARRERRVHRMRVIPRGATLVVLLHRRGRVATSSPTTFRRGRNPVIYLQGPGGLRSHRGSSRHRGLPCTTTSTTFTRERFPLNGLHTGM